MKRAFLLFSAFVVSAGLAAQDAGKSKIIEQVVARVNNEIITVSDLDRAQAELLRDAQEACGAKCTPEQVASMAAEKQKDVLRDLIDHSLLAQRGKDLGINVEAQVIKKLDEIRQQNGLGSMEELQSAIEKEGQSFEEFKNQLRNSILVQEVIRREVGQDIIIDHAEIAKYYNEHQDEFKRPDMVYLREIFVSTDGKKEEEIPDLQKKADKLLERVKKGEDFGQLAIHFSDGQTAKQGGELGSFEHGQLDPKIEAVVFKLNKNDLTSVIQTKNGFMILQVEMRYEAGMQPIEKVDPEIQNKLYMVKMEPALRKYLQTLREESYVVIKAGYTDTAAVTAPNSIEEMSSTPDSSKSNKPKGKSAKGKVISAATGKKSGS
jgi:peptidyl-prolyl cis-trans isomerase SurA